MMSLNRENYEIYFIDFFDGNLDFEKEAKLMEFLEENPDLKLEFEDFENVGVSEIEAPLPFDKNVLKKSISIDTSNADDYFIASHEGDLDEREEHELKMFLNDNPKLLKRKQEFKLARVIADESIIFPSKMKLKRGMVLSIFSNQKLWLAAAAVILLFLIVRGLNFSTSAEKRYEARVPEASPFIEAPAYAYFDYYSNGSLKQMNNQKGKTNYAFGNSIQFVSQTPNIIIFPNEIHKVSIGDKEKYGKLKSIMINNFQDEKLALTPIQSRMIIDVESGADLAEPLAYSNNIFTVKEFLRYQFRKRILKQTKPGKEAINNEELFASINPVVDKLKPSYLTTQKEEENHSKITTIRLGRSFEFVRSKSMDY